MCFSASKNVPVYECLGVWSVGKKTATKSRVRVGIMVNESLPPG